jgi:hypothetical protein
MLEFFGFITITGGTLALTVYGAHQLFTKGHRIVAGVLNALPGRQPEMSRSRIALLLRNNPNDWRFDKYEAVHKSGLKVWIANSSYGLHVDIGHDRVNLSAIERRLIWDEVKKIKRVREEKKERALNKKLDSILESAENEE